MWNLVKARLKLFNSCFVFPVNHHPFEIIFQCKPKIERERQRKKLYVKCVVGKSVDILCLFRNINNGTELPPSQHDLRLFFRINVHKLYENETSSNLHKIIASSLFRFWYNGQKSCNNNLICVAKPIYGTMHCKCCEMTWIDNCISCKRASFMNISHMHIRLKCFE